MKDILLESALIPWSLFIDIEGFRVLFEDEEEKVLWFLNNFMKNIIDIGIKGYPDDGERLFIHQLGDGFIIFPNIGDKDLLKPISIASVLMQLSAVNGGFLKAGISYGGHGDYSGCYPLENCEKNGNVIRLGSGLMTYMPVLGMGLIRAYQISECAIGPILIIDRKLTGFLEFNQFESRCYKNHIEINWLKISTHVFNDLVEKLSIELPTPESIKAKLKDYITSYPELSDLWKKAAENVILSY
jgi:hypothetical protein